MENMSKEKISFGLLAILISSVGTLYHGLRSPVYTWVPKSDYKGDIWLHSSQHLLYPYYVSGTMFCKGT